jgi:hypothetical protein
MICPKCQVQMHQKAIVGSVKENKKVDVIFVGGGDSTDNDYKTWSVQECPGCGQLIKETYAAEFITDEQLKAIIEK